MQIFRQFLFVALIHPAQAFHMSRTDGLRVCILSQVQFKNAPAGSRKHEVFEYFFSPYSPVKGLPQGTHNGEAFGKNYPCLPAFNTDDDAAAFYRQFYIPQQEDFKIAASDILTSFGSADETFGFTDTREMVLLIGESGSSAYLDALSLPEQLGAYRLRKDISEIYKSRHVYWKEYYMYQIGTARAMVFLVTDAWMASENCWEELDWAANRKMRQGYNMINMVYLISDKAKQFYYIKDGDSVPKFHEKSRLGGLTEKRMPLFDNLAYPGNSTTIVKETAMPNTCAIALELMRVHKRRFFDFQQKACK